MMKFNKIKNGFKIMFKESCLYDTLVKGKKISFSLGMGHLLFDYRLRFVDTNHDNIYDDIVFDELCVCFFDKPAFILECKQYDIKDMKILFDLTKPIYLKDLMNYLEDKVIFGDNNVDYTIDDLANALIEYLKNYYGVLRK